MASTHRWDPGRILIGLIIVIFGMLLIAEQAGWTDAADIIGRWWPVVIIAAGVIHLATSPRLTVGPLIVITVGAVLLLNSLALTSTSIWGFIWPLILVAVGLSVVFGRAGFGGRRASNEASFNRFSLFSGQDVINEGTAVTGGWVGAFFGGLSLDLRHAQLAPEGANVDATVMFGGIDVLVPQGWRIELSGVPIFGGFEDKTRSDQPLPADAPVLRINTVVLFGGLAVKHEK